jgi:hypothetical protein
MPRVTTPDHIRAHRHSSFNREELLASELCGCFSCCTTFPPSKIQEWADRGSGIGQTAVCPKCGIDSIIGSESGYPLTDEFLARMNQHWCS